MLRFPPSDISEYKFMRYTLLESHYNDSNSKTNNSRKRFFEKIVYGGWFHIILVMLHEASSNTESLDTNPIPRDIVS